MLVTIALPLPRPGVQLFLSDSEVQEAWSEAARNDQQFYWGIAQVIVQKSPIAPSEWSLVSIYKEPELTDQLNEYFGLPPAVEEEIPDDSEALSDD